VTLVRTERYCFKELYKAVKINSAKKLELTASDPVQ